MGAPEQQITAEDIPRLRARWNHALGTCDPYAVAAAAIALASGLGAARRFDDAAELLLDAFERVGPDREAWDARADLAHVIVPIVAPRTPEAVCATLVKLIFSSKEDSRAWPLMYYRMCDAMPLMDEDLLKRMFFAAEEWYVSGDWPTWREIDDHFGYRPGYRAVSKTSSSSPAASSSVSRSPSVS